MSNHLIDRARRSLPTGAAAALAVASLFPIDEARGQAAPPVWFIRGNGLRPDQEGRNRCPQRRPCLAAWPPPGEACYDPIEAKLACFPTITLVGDANGAPDPEPAAYARMFTGRHEHRLITGGIGHNLPQDAPPAFTQAVLDMARA